LGKDRMQIGVGSREGCRPLFSWWYLSWFWASLNPAQNLP